MSDEYSDLEDAIRDALQKAGKAGTDKQVKAAMEGFFDTIEFIKDGEFSSKKLEKLAEQSIHNIRHEVERTAGSAKAQVDMIGDILCEARQKQDDINELVRNWNDGIEQKKKATSTLHSEQAVDAITIFSLIMKIGIDNGVSPDIANRSASYATYAFLTKEKLTEALFENVEENIVMASKPKSNDEYRHHRRV